MKISELIEQLERVMKVYGDYNVRILTDTEKHGQIEQNAGEIAVSDRRKAVIILPEGFT